MHFETLETYMTPIDNFRNQEPVRGGFHSLLLQGWNLLYISCVQHGKINGILKEGTHKNPVGLETGGSSLHGAEREFHIQSEMLENCCCEVHSTGRQSHSSFERCWS